MRSIFVDQYINGLSNKAQTTREQPQSGLCLAQFPSRWECEKTDIYLSNRAVLCRIVDYHCTIVTIQSICSVCLCCCRPDLQSTACGSHATPSTTPVYLRPETLATAKEIRKWQLTPRYLAVFVRVNIVPSGLGFTVDSRSLHQPGRLNA
jgi:hypothetical protein